MKALTICQPYADMIATGEKAIENRTWPTAYRGLLAIHAGKSRAWLSDEDERERPNMPFGAVVAMANLVACVPVADVPSELREQQPEHVNGPWCWILEDVQRFNPPIPARGAQGLWEWMR